KLAYYGIQNTNFTVRQNTQDLKEEILSELNKNQTEVTQKDLQIQELRNALAATTFGDPTTETEIKILFPEVKDVYFGVINQFSDSVKTKKLVLYQADRKIDEEKLGEWLAAKFNKQEIIIQKQVSP